MINEASGLRIASDFINNKIAKKIRTIRENKDNNLNEKLEKELAELIKIQEQVEMGNYTIINQIIKKIEVKQNG